MFAPFHRSWVPFGLVSWPYGAKPALFRLIDAARVMAVLAISRPPVVTMPAPCTVPLPVIVVPDTAPVEATDPTAAAPETERLLPWIAPVTVTSDPARLPSAATFPVMVRLPPPEMSPVASIVLAFSRGFPLKSTPAGFKTG